MRVLGVDPGTVVTGWGLVEQRGSRLRRLDGGVIRCRGALPSRLAAIYEHMQDLLERFAPHCLSLEKSFVGTNVQSAFRLGEARGVILAACAQGKIEVHEYAPAEVKVAITGAGRATKDQVQRMVSRLLGIEDVRAADEADALAAAICHLHRARYRQLESQVAAIPRTRGGTAARAAWTRLASNRASLPRSGAGR